jgi:hypothetical protein
MAWACILFGRLAIWQLYAFVLAQRKKKKWILSNFNRTFILQHPKP